MAERNRTPSPPAQGATAGNMNERKRELKNVRAENERLRMAIRVIHTWASVDGALIPEQVIELCKKALSD